MGLAEQLLGESDTINLSMIFKFIYCPKKERMDTFICLFYPPRKDLLAVIMKTNGES